MSPSGDIQKTGTGAEKRRKGLSFSERIAVPDGLPRQEPVRINTDSILMFPDLDRAYSLKGVICTGGNALVSLAEDKFLKRTVVLKSLRGDLQNDPVKRRSFLREAQLMAQLDHPFIVPVYGSVRDSAGGLHIVMKRICGESLRELLKKLRDKYSSVRMSRTEERKSLILRLILFTRVCDAIAFAHSKRVLHGDLKPGNIMIENLRNVYVMDWGNAQIVKDDPDFCILKDTISGTPGYLPPEAVRGECMDFRSEVFTLGLILFELVTLSKAVTGATARDILLKLRDGKCNPIRHKFNIPISRDLRAILKKALQPDREKRYQSVSEIAEEIRNYLSQFPGTDPSGRKR